MQDQNRLREMLHRLAAQQQVDQRPDPAPLPDSLLTDEARPQPPLPPVQEVDRSLELPPPTYVDQQGNEITHTPSGREAGVFDRLGQLGQLQKVQQAAPPSLKPKVQQIADQHSQGSAERLQQPGLQTPEQEQQQAKADRQSLNQRLRALASVGTTLPNPRKPQMVQGPYGKYEKLSGSQTPGGSLSRMQIAENENEAMLRDQNPPSAADQQLRQRVEAAYAALQSRSTPSQGAYTALPSKAQFIADYIRNQPQKDVAARDRAGLQLPKATTPAFNMLGYDLGQKAPSVVQNPQTQRIQANLPEFTQQPYDPEFAAQRMKEAQAEFQQQPAYQQQAQKVLTGIQQGWGQHAANAVATLEKIGTLGYSSRLQTALDDRSREIAMDAAAQGPSITRDVAHMVSSVVPYAVTSLAGPVAGSVKLGHILAIGGVSASGEDWRDPEHAITNVAINTALGAAMVHISPAIEGAAVSGGAKVLPVLQRAFDRQTSLTIAAAGATIGASASEAAIGAGLFSGAAYAAGERDPYKLKLAAVFGAAFPIASGLKGLVKLGLTAKQQIGDIAPDAGAYGRATDPDFWKNYNQELGQPAQVPVQPGISEGAIPERPLGEGAPVAGTKTLEGAQPGQTIRPLDEMSPYPTTGPKTLGDEQGGQVVTQGNGTQRTVARTQSESTVPQETPAIAPEQGAVAAADQPPAQTKPSWGARLMGLFGRSPNSENQVPNTHSAIDHGVIVDPKNAMAEATSGIAGLEAQLAAQEQAKKTQAQLAQISQSVDQADQMMQAARAELATEHTESTEAGQSPSSSSVSSVAQLSPRSQQALEQAQKTYSAAISGISSTSQYKQELAAPAGSPTPLVALVDELKGKLQGVQAILKPEQPKAPQKTKEQRDAEAQQKKQEAATEKEAERQKNFALAQGVVDKYKSAGFIAEEKGDLEGAIKNLAATTTAYDGIIGHAPDEATRQELRIAKGRIVDRIKRLQAQLKPQSGNGNGTRGTVPTSNPNQPQLGITNPEGGVPEASQQPVDFDRLAQGEAPMEQGEHLSLEAWVHRQGGLRPTSYNAGDEQRLRSLEGGRPGIINQHGITADTLREMAEGEGYGPYETVDDFMNALIDRGKNTFPVTGQTGNREAEYQMTEGEARLDHAIAIDPEVDAAYQALKANPYDAEAYLDLGQLTLGQLHNVPRETIQALREGLQQQHEEGNLDFNPAEFESFLDQARSAGVPPAEIAQAREAFEQGASAIENLEHDPTAQALLDRIAAGDTELTQTFIDLVGAKHGIQPETARALIESRRAKLGSRNENRLRPAHDAEPQTPVGEVPRPVQPAPQAGTPSGQPAIGHAQRLSSAERRVLNRKPEDVPDAEYPAYLAEVERIHADRERGNLRLDTEEETAADGKPQYAAEALRQKFDGVPKRDADGNIVTVRNKTQWEKTPVDVAARDEYNNRRKIAASEGDARRLALFPPLNESRYVKAEDREQRIKEREAKWQQGAKNNAPQTGATENAPLQAGLQPEKIASGTTPVESTPVEPPPTSHSGLRTSDSSTQAPTQAPSQAGTHTQPTEGGLFGNVAPKTQEELGIPHISILDRKLPEATISSKAISALIPYTMAGTKPDLLSRTTGRIAQRAASRSKRLIDAFGGAGTYLHFLRSRGYRHPGDIWNELDPFRYITNYQLQQNPGQVIAEVKRILGELRPFYAQFLDDVGRPWRDAHKDAQKAINQWFQNEVYKMIVPGTDLRQIYASGRPVPLVNSPQTAAFYYVIQNQRFGSRAIQAEATPGGRIAKLIPSDPEIGIIAPTKDLVRIYRTGNDRFTEVGDRITAVSGRLQNAHLLNEDGWQLVREQAGAGDLVPVDTSYLDVPNKPATDNYDNLTAEDSQAEIWMPKVEQNLLPAWKRGAMLLVTNNWNPEVAEYLQGLGFKVYWDTRETGKGEEEQHAPELIAVNFDPLTLKLETPQRSAFTGRGSIRPGTGAAPASGAPEHQRGRDQNVNPSASEPVATGTEEESGGSPRPAREREQRRGEDRRGVEVNRTAPPFYSQLQKVVLEKIPARATPAQILATLRNPANGVKESELKWTDLEGFLRGKQNVTRQEVLDFIRENNAQVEQVIKGGPHTPSLSDPEIATDVKTLKDAGWIIDTAPDDPAMLGFIDPEYGDIADAAELRSFTQDQPELKPIADAATRIEKYWHSKPTESITKYSQHVSPGGNEGSYRELLITLPVKPRRTFRVEQGRAGSYSVIDEQTNQTLHSGLPRAEADAKAKELMQQVAKSAEGEVYNEPHWPGHPNVVAHLRADERTHSDGVTGLVIDETQRQHATDVRKMGEKLPEAKYKEQRDRLNSQTNIAEANFVEVDLKLDTLEKKAIALIKDLRSKMPAFTVYDKDWKVVWQGDDHKEAFIKKHETGPRASLIERDLQPIEDTEELKALYQQAKELRPQKYKANNALQSLMDERRSLNETQRTGVPPLPFSKSWPQLTVKAALRYAAEQGLERMSIMPARTHIERWGTERAAWKKIDEPGKWKVEYFEPHEPVAIEEYDTKQEAEARAEELGSDNSPSTYFEPGRKGYLLEFKAQEGGHAAGLDLEAEGLARGLVNPESATFVTSLAGVKDAIHDSGQATGDVEGIANKVWSHMQEKDEGAVWPRAEGLLAHYGDTADYIKSRFPNRPDLMKYAWDRPSGKSEARMAIAMRDVAKKWKAEVGVKGLKPIGIYTDFKADYIARHQGDVAPYVVKGQIHGGDWIELTRFETKREAEAWLENENKERITPILSADITTEMRRSVLEEGQPLFERAKWDTPQMYKGQNEADILAQTRAEFHAHKGQKRQGMLWVNGQSAYAIDQAMKRLGEEEGGAFNGLSINKSWVNRVTRELERMGKEKWWNEEALPNLQNLARQLQRAASDPQLKGSDISLARIDQIRPETNQGPLQLARGTATHERGIHASQSELGQGDVTRSTSSEAWLDVDPDAEKRATAALMDKGYPYAQTAAEIVAHLAQGKDDELGVTPAEGKKLLASYFNQVYVEHGTKGLAVFERNLPGHRAAQIIKGVKNAQTNTRGQQTQSGLARPRPATLEPGRAAENGSSQEARADLRTSAEGDRLARAGSRGDGEGPAGARERKSVDPSQYFSDLTKKLKGQLKEGNLDPAKMAPVISAIQRGIAAASRGDKKGVDEAKLAALEAFNQAGQRRGLQDKLMGFMMANLLSGASTIVKPPVASGFHTFNRTLAKFIAAPIDYGLGKAWGQVKGQRTVTTPRFSELASMTRAALASFGDVARKIATGASYTDIKMGAHLFEIPEVEGNWLGRYQRLYSRIHAAIHIPAFAAAHTLALMSQARIYALKFPKGAQRKAAYNAFLDDPSPEALAIASLEGQEATLYSENIYHDLVGQLISKIEHKAGPPGRLIGRAYKFVSPFSRVQFNKVARFFDYTGVNAGIQAGRLILGKNEKTQGSLPPKKGNTVEEQKEMAERLGRAGIGFFYFLGGMLLGAAGYALTREEKQKQKAVEEARGHKAGSIEAFARSFDPTALEPFGSVFQAGVETAHAIAEARKKQEQEFNSGKPMNETTSPAWAGGKQFIKENIRQLAEIPPIKAATALTEMASSRGGAGDLSKTNLAPRVIPGPVRDLANLLDRREKKPAGMVESAMANLPFLSQKVPSKRDILGREHKQALPGDIFKSQELTSTPALDEAARLEVGRTQVKAKQGESRESVEQREHRAALWYDTATQGLIDHPDYWNLSDEVKKRAWDEAARLAAEFSNEKKPRVLLLSPGRLIAKARVGEMHERVKERKDARTKIYNAPK